jgi:hypothetical protein
MRGKGAAVGPMCLQFGQVIRVSIEARCYRHGGGVQGTKVNNSGSLAILTPTPEPCH